MIPIHLRQLSSEQRELAGRVTLVGKVILAVRHARADYLDQATFQQWAGAPFWTAMGPNNLVDAATVLSPAGYVIQPLAIYK